MDLFEEYLNKKDAEKLIEQALTDTSYKNVQQKNKDDQPQPTNNIMATLGDSIIKLCLSDHLFYTNAENITEDKKKYESDEFLVSKVAKHYNLLKYINFDKDDERKPRDYEYKKSKSGNPYKYIATAVEAMICAIYILKDRDLTDIQKLIVSWINL